MAESIAPHRGSPPPNDALSAARVAFPQTPDDFEADPRVAFSKLDNKWELEEDDGSMWEYNEASQRWVPLVDEALLEQQRKAYAVDGVDENQPAVQPKKRKNEDNNGDVAANGKAKKARADEKPKAEKQNTAVYVTSLPLDVTVKEVAQTFSKCGVLAESVDTGEPRVKLYTDEQGNFKGEALVVYFRPESVGLAIQLLDDEDFRIGQEGPTGKMRVTEAERSFKKQKEPSEKRTTKDKKKVQASAQKMNSKLADWDDDDPQTLKQTSSRFDKVVILKHMFTLEELQKDKEAAQDITEDVREECSTLGDVLNVTLFDKEADGVVSVRFSNTEAARACVTKMDGRMFGGAPVEAHIADGSERFQKTFKHKHTDKTLDRDDEDEDEKRLEVFGAWLEQEQH